MVTAITIACSQTEGFHISGSVANDFDDYIYLKYGDQMDSSLVSEGKFEFKGTVDYPTEAQLRTKNSVGAAQLYLQNENMETSLIIKENVTFLESIHGSTQNEKEEQIGNFMMEHRDDNDFADQLYARLDTLFKSQPQSQWNGELLADIAMDPILSREQIQDLKATMDTTTQNEEYLTSIQESLEKYKTFDEGQAFIDFELPDEEGKPINTTDYRGSILLVEVWASWCGPCRAEHPDLLEVYDQFHSQGFDILGVSIDPSDKEWQKAIEKDRLTWENVRAKDSWEEEALEPLKIHYVPSNFLIDQEGTILAVNISPSGLKEKLHSLLE